MPFTNYSKDEFKIIYVADCIIRRNAEKQLKICWNKVELFHAKLDREFADAVLGIAIKANWQVAQELRGDGSMCEALMELMEPEINKIGVSMKMG